MSHSVGVIGARFTGFCAAGTRGLPGPFPEVSYCSLSALFMWVILEGLSSGVLDLELYYKGKDGPGEAIICIISQEIPDPGKR